MQEDSLTQPPLPRYRFDVSTGGWRKEVALTSSGKAGTSSTRRAKPVVMLASDTPESSYDYFLRKSYATEVDKTAAAAAAERARNRTLSQISDFERQHQQRLTAEGVMATEGLPNPRDRAHQQSVMESVHAGYYNAAGQSFHPILGFLVDVSLPTVAAALAQVADGSLLNAAGAALSSTNGQSTAGPRLLVGSPTLAVTLPLSFDDFIAFLSLVGPVQMMSENYVREQLFQTLPPYDAASKSVSATALFTFIAQNTFHPALDSNVRMLFHAFDADQRGAVPGSCLQASRVRQWSSKNAFGLLRMEWDHFAAALEREEMLAGERSSSKTAEEQQLVLHAAPPAAARPFGGTVQQKPKWLTSEMVVMFLCASPRLFKVANSVDLEGSSLRSRDA